jgi:arylsulfatase A-like enzyme
MPLINHCYPSRIEVPDLRTKRLSGIIALLIAWGVAAQRPNIIVMLADDMGYSDIGCYGAEVQTPNLDTLAANGLRFTQFYNTARCCPTRASLLSGLYPHQAGVGHMMNDRGYDGYRGTINKQCRTIAEVLRPVGYGTYMSGKWHISKTISPDGPKDHWPLQRGFDRFYGTIHGAGSFFDPNTLTRDNSMISPYADPEYPLKDGVYYYTDAISDHAVRFINEHHASNPDAPFFIYVAYTAAHWPMHALERDIAKYKGKYDAGYAAIREARYERMLKLGVIDAKWPMSPAPEEWEENPNKAWDARNMEVYAAMIDNMDQGIGRIMAALKKNGIFDNTLMLYMQDNGGCAEGLGRSTRGQKTRADKPTLPPMDPAALQPSMIPQQTRDGWPVLMGPGVMPGPADTYIAYGRGWANVSNVPFREYKHWVHEGGISTPLVAHWPKGIQRKNQLEHQPGHLIDIMATCVDIAGAEYPKEVGGVAIKPMEGRSLRPAFAGKTIDREAIYWEHEGNRAVRVGAWKLVAKGANGAWELYNIAEDRSELRNLATDQPERVKALAAMWQAYAERANVLPLNPRPPRKEKLSNQKKFNLKPDADLAREQAPNVKERPFAVSATIDGEKAGVIVAQGGSSHGWALLVADSKLTFVTRINGEIASVAIEDDLPAGQVTVSAELDKAGIVTLVAGERKAQGKVGLMLDMPLDGLQAGQDQGGEVGTYEIPNAFEGSIKSLKVQLK